MARKESHSSKSGGDAVPKAGDMVEFPRMRGTYDHYGIADGKGNVYHATSDYAASGSVIKKEPLQKVASGGNFKVSNQDDKKNPLPPEVIVARAEARIGEKVPYSLLTNNCETVASEMRYGKGQGHSEQGERITKKYDEQTKEYLRNPGSHNPFDGGSM